MKSKKDKEFYWVIVDFILFKVINLQKLTMDKFSKEFNRDDLINIFDLLGITVEDFSKKIHSFVGDNDVYKMVRDDTIPLEYFLESYDIYL